MDEPAPALLDIFVTGKPEPGGSKKGFINPKNNQVVITDANSKVKGWRKAVAAEAKLAWGARELLDEMPLAIELTFFQERPGSHYGTGRNAHLVKDGSNAMPLGPPDVTKFTRAVEDALSKVVYRDDSLIVDAITRKRYGPRPGVRIVLRAAFPAKAVDLPIGERVRVLPDTDVTFGQAAAEAGDQVALTL